MVIWGHSTPNTGVITTEYLGQGDVRKTSGLLWLRVLEAQTQESGDSHHPDHPKTA